MENIGTESTWFVAEGNSNSEVLEMGVGKLSNASVWDVGDVLEKMGNRAVSGEVSRPVTGDVGNVLVKIGNRVVHGRLLGSREVASVG